MPDLIANAEWHHFLLAACGVAFLGGFLKGARVGLGGILQGWMLTAAFLVAVVAFFKFGVLVAIGIYLAANIAACWLGFVVGVQVTGGRGRRDGPV